MYQLLKNLIVLFVNFSLEEQTVPEIKPDLKPGNLIAIDIDVALIDFIVDSNNESVPTPQYLRKAVSEVLGNANVN